MTNLEFAGLYNYLYFLAPTNPNYQNLGKNHHQLHTDAPRKLNICSWHNSYSDCNLRFWAFSNFLEEFLEEFLEAF